MRFRLVKVLKGADSALAGTAAAEPRAGAEEASAAPGAKTVAATVAAAMTAADTAK